MAEITYQLIKKPIEERLLDAACIYWNVDRQYFANPEIKKESTSVYRRRVVCYLLKQNTLYSYREISTKFGYLSTSRIQEGVESIDAQRDVLRQINDDINQISYLADKLDADFITSSISLENKKIS